MPAFFPTLVDRAERSVWRQIALSAAAGAIFGVFLEVIVHRLSGGALVELLATALCASAAAAYMTWRYSFAWRQLYSVARDLEEAARRDQQTGLLNHSAFFDAAAAAISTMPAASLLVVDIDRFKSVNDSFGHLAGDTVIAEAAARLRTAFPPETILGRMGGEEFAALMPLTEREAFALAEKFRKVMDREAIMVRADALRVTVSIGVAQMNQTGTISPCDAFNRVYGEADRALYIAKAAGRNRTAMASEVSAVFEPNEPDIDWAGSEERLSANG
jgi:diguanylate cyclase (GGDEF)-like protein